MMSYKEALEAAGAEVILFKGFGSYQGDWWAKVKYNGHEGWVTGSYGSCSGCDAFEAEFDWGDNEKDDYQSRLCDFGKGYLDDILTQDEAEEAASKYLDWDFDAQEMVDWIRQNKQTRQPEAGNKEKEKYGEIK